LISIPTKARRYLLDGSFPWMSPTITKTWSLWTFYYDGHFFVNDRLFPIQFIGNRMCNSLFSHNDDKQYKWRRSWLTTHHCYFLRSTLIPLLHVFILLWVVDELKSNHACHFFSDVPLLFLFRSSMI
jgi:hypothetical protein